ncbi:low affinity iron permease family protein [Gellertiella hungarica]|uniref:Low affinity Fe/Cu permease n=1 Tax=Gellertiella hungarica TaxID=1572859 RepID=A0A7W6NM70_9HYPH|nr:low affinity iron permease family protein [Gellertiella hungarica]MBB4066175.1 low affinity Fe/Cu permease [Gellertiella hungarica]
MTPMDASQETEKPKTDYFALFSNAVSEWAGKPVTFVLAVGGICIWAALGPFLDYSESWQLVVNTATTIITFLMIFVLQNSQNRDAKALQVKLDELILTNARAENCFIGAEALGEAELLRLRALLDAKLKAAEEGKSAEVRQDIEEHLEEKVRSAKIA